MSSKPLLSILLGMLLLAPATFFFMTLTWRICFGPVPLYYEIAPSFLQSPFHPFAPHKAQLIIDSLILAILFNLLAILQFRLVRGKWGLDVQLYYRRRWLHMALTLQSALLFLVLMTYILIQHIRY